MFRPMRRFNRLSTSRAAAARGNLGGTRHLPEVDGRVVGAAEPVEPPVAAGLQRLGEAVALLAVADASVLRSPAVRGRSPLVGAAVEDADAAAGNLKTSISASVSVVKIWQN